MVRPQFSPKFAPKPAAAPPNAMATSAQQAEAQPAKPPAKILFQKFFKSVGTRTYAAQVKEFGNGNHALVLIEGKRDKQTDEVKKHSLYLFSEDFAAFMDMVDEVRQFIADHPVPESVRERQKAYFAKGGKPGGKWGGKGGFRAKPAAATA